MVVVASSAVACSGAGSGAASEPTGKEWPIDQIMRTGLGSAAFRECGRLPVQRGSTPALRDVRTCVDNALGEARPFVTRWFVEGNDTTVASGYLGRYEGNEVKLYYLHFDSYPCSGPECSPCNTNVTRCKRLTPAASCNNLDTTLCLTCVDPVAVDMCPPPPPP